MIENDLMIGLKARQIGMTTVTAGYAFWDAFFHENHPWLMISKNEDGAKKMLARILYAYDRLPQFLKDRKGHKVVTRTQTMIAFENGSSIEALPSVASTGRGDSVYGAVLDEFAFMDYAAEVFAAVEPLVYGKMILISTANGMGNRFHEIWVDSSEPDSPWAGMFFPWSEVPERDQAWYDRRWLKYRGQEWKFFQEYPSNPEEAFAKSGRVAFTHDLLSWLEWRDPDFFDWNRERQEFLPTSTESPFSLRVWEEPAIEVDPDWNDVIVRKPNYVIGVDTAEGLDHGDYTAVTVWDANNKALVASLYAHFPVEELHEILFDLGEWYYWALIIIERNNHGLVPLVNLQGLRYPRLYRPKPLASRNRKRSLDLGWTTTNQSKAKMVVDFIEALANRQVDIPDETFRLEAQVFVADGKGSYAATEGKHDDFIMGTLVGWQGVLDVGRFPPIFYEPDNHPVTFDEFFSQGKPKKGPAGLDSMVIGNRPLLSGEKTAYFLRPQNIRPKTERK